MKIFDVIKIGFICSAIAICICGCKISQQEYRGFEVGEIRQTEVDSYVRFGYATFIWQNPRDWQEMGDLMSFPKKLDDEDKEKITLLKRNGSLEMERDFYNHSGGMIYFIPKGTTYEIDKIYTVYPSQWETGSSTYIEIKFTNGPLKDKKADLTLWAYPSSKTLNASKHKLDGKDAQSGEVRDPLSTPCGIFPGMQTPLQLAVGTWGLFNPKGTTVYGLSLNLAQSRLENCYGISISPLMNANVNQYGVSAGLINANQNTHGLSIGQCNAFEVNYGVSVGVFNLQIPKFEKGNKPKMNFLQIGLFNFADSGCQIGLLNCNETAKIRILPFFNFSPFPENSGTDKK